MLGFGEQLEYLTWPGLTGARRNPTPSRIARWGRARPPNLKSAGPPARTWARDSGEQPRADGTATEWHAQWPPTAGRAAVLNQGDQGENLIPPSLILIPDIPDIPEVPWVPSGA